VDFDSLCFDRSNILAGTIPSSHPDQDVVMFLVGPVERRGIFAALASRLLKLHSRRWDSVAMCRAKH
jgi:hypothetical protein